MELGVIYLVKNPHTLLEMAVLRILCNKKLDLRDSSVIIRLFLHYQDVICVMFSDISSTVDENLSHLVLPPAWTVRSQIVPPLVWEITVHDTIFFIHTWYNYGIKTYFTRIIHYLIDTHTYNHKIYITHSKNTYKFVVFTNINEFSYNINIIN